MKATLRALLTGVIDYAGMFPPASLPLEQSIRNYLRYLTEPESWMLGRFICPAAKLHELTPFLQGLDLSSPLLISALGKGGSVVTEFVANTSKDRDAIVSFREQNRGRAVVDVFEVRLPAEVPGEPVESAMCGLEPSIPDVEWFLESPHRPDSAEFQRTVQGFRQPGFKFRCGGTEPAAYPSPKDLAWVIDTCSKTNRQLKFTAGLHHPMRHFNTGAGVTMHGFINVFYAAACAYSWRDNRPEHIEGIIEYEDPGTFVITDQEMRLKGWRLTTEWIRAARQRVVSFGSCSFDEPRDDLRKLGWLP
jgi:hypothetical protein